MRVRRGWAVLAVMLSVGGCGGAAADSAPAVSGTAPTGEPPATATTGAPPAAAPSGTGAATPATASSSAVAGPPDAPEGEAASTVVASGSTPTPKTTSHAAKPPSRSKDSAEPQKAGAKPPSPAATPEAPPSSIGTFACGEKGQKACPLQGWMKANMAVAVASGDTAQLASQFDYVAAHTPPGMPNWASIAKLGASKARASDLDGAKATCKTCHDQYKAKYKQQLRDRAF